MGKRGWTILSLCLLTIVGTTCYFLFAGEAEDPNLAPLKEEVKKIQEQNLSPQQTMAAYRQIREKAKNLSDEAKRELRQVGMKGMRKIMNQRMDNYFNAPPEKKKAILDQQIREMEAMRAQFASMRGQGRGRGGQAGGGHGGRRNPPANQEERDQRRKDRLNRHEPEDRARMMEYFSAIRDRRKELGLPEMRGPHRH